MFAGYLTGAFREFVSQWASMTRRPQRNKAPWMDSCVSRKAPVRYPARQPQLAVHILMSLVAL